MELKTLFQLAKITSQYTLTEDFIDYFTFYYMLSEWKHTVWASGYQPVSKKSRDAVVVVDGQLTAWLGCWKFVLQFSFAAVRFAVDLAQYIVSNSACSQWQNVGFGAKMKGNVWLWCSSVRMLTSQSCWDFGTAPLLIVPNKTPLPAVAQLYHVTDSGFFACAWMMFTLLLLHFVSSHCGFHLWT